MIRHLISLVLFSCLVFNSTLKAQMLGLDLLGGKSRIEIPFEYKQDYIVIKLMFNNILPLNFMLDTGAEHTMLFHKPFADILGLKYDQEVSIIGADLSSIIKAYVTRGVFLKLEKLPSVKRDIVVLGEDHLRLDELTGVQIDGILGGTFFHGLVLEINYEKNKLILHNPDNFGKKFIKGFTEFDLEINHHKPYIIASTSVVKSRSAKVKLLIDTGAALTYLIHTNTDSLLSMPENIISGNLGQGLGGIVEGYVGKCDNLELDKFKFENIITNFQDVDSFWLENKKLNRNGILGNILLSRFHVILDYTRRKLYLKANKSYTDEFRYDKSGLLIFAFGKDLNDFYVKDVIPGSPADLAGLQTGDIIKKIGFWPSGFVDLNHILQKLSGKHGDKISMKVQRNGECIKKSFRLKDFFLPKAIQKSTKLGL